MENTLLVGLSRQVSLERQLDIVANNMANINTTGFKADKSLFEEYLSQSASADDFRGRDRKVSFVVDRATWHDFAQGSYEKTGNPLDIAIEGSNAFLTVQTPAGERYTRNGALQVNAQGQIVTADGFPVLGSSGPIVLQPGDQSISIARDGTVTVREGANVNVDSLRGKLRLVTFDQAQRLQKEGANLFSAPAGMTAQAATETSGLRQGFIEKSNVSAVAEMSRMIEVMRTYTQISSLLQQQNDIQKSAIEKLAEVPA